MRQTCTCGNEQERQLVIRSDQSEPGWSLYFSLDPNIQAELGYNGTPTIGAYCDRCGKNADLTDQERAFGEGILDGALDVSLYLS